VIVLIGDGTYLMSPTEILTAVQERLKLTVVVLDNHGYQSISGLAHGNLGQSIGNEFRSRNGSRVPDGEPLRVDYTANAASLGAAVCDVTSVDELTQALAKARAADGTSVIVCATTNDPPVPWSGAFWDLAVPEVSDDPKTRALAAAIVKGRDQQRTY
jgi:3D-(3,5/4)-trihydroxycyclohexane-1,2-dione acylhydrolase (decyclizing)